MRGSKRTVHTGVVGLDVGRLDFAVFNDKGVTLGAVLTKDCGALEGEVKVLGELARGIAEEADLQGGSVDEEATDA